MAANIATVNSLGTLSVRYVLSCIFVLIKLRIQLLHFDEDEDVVVNATVAAAQKKNSEKKILWSLTNHQKPLWQFAQARKKITSDEISPGPAAAEVTVTRLAS